MKNIHKIIKQTALCLIFTAMTVFAYAQPPRCDSMSYDYEHTRKPILLDSMVTYAPPQILTEFDPCADGTLKRKNITFIHGLGGGVASWDKQKVWTDQNYQSAVIIAEYTGASWESSFHSVAEKLNNNITGGLAGGVNAVYPNRCPDDDFAIAHSQGGIAARYLDRQWNLPNPNGTFGVQNFNGLVTFGTPHAGADIALTRTEHAAFINQVIHSIYLKDVYNLRGLSGKLDKLLDSVTVFTEEKLVPVMVAGVHTNTLDEMRYDNQTMIDINNHQSRLHKVAFYGVEDAPECWRVISNMVDVAAEEYPIWTATEDNFFINKAQEALDNHIGEINANDRKYKLIKNTAGWSHPKYVLLSGGTDQALARLKKENYERNKAKLFLENANDEWRYLIGSYNDSTFTYDTTSFWMVEWKEQQASNGYNTNPLWTTNSQRFGTYGAAINYRNLVYANPYKTIKDFTITQEYEYTKHRVFFPSDGVVLTKSQKAFPGVDISNVREMRGDSHFQERNSPNALTLFEALYNGDFGTFFTTPEK